MIYGTCCGLKGAVGSCKIKTNSSLKKVSFVRDLRANDTSAHSGSKKKAYKHLAARKKIGKVLKGDRTLRALR